MSQQTINIGSAPNDGTGDPLRTSFDKSNDNFTDLYKGAGGIAQGLWNFDATSTNTATAPVSGRFKTNSGNYRDATQLAIHGTSIQGIDRRSTLRTLLAGDIIQCQDSTNSAAWCRYNLQSTPVDNSTWFQCNVTLETDGGVASGDNQEIVFVFTANKSGAGGGGNVSSSGTPTNGQLAQWTDATHIQGINATSLNFAPINSPTFTGDPQAPTPATADNDTSIATTAFVKAQGYVTGGPYAPLASPVFTGDPKAPTPTAGDNDTSIATTAFVTAAVAASPAVLPGAKVLISTQTVSSAVAQVDFTTGIDATYDVYEVEFFGVQPANNSVDLNMRVSKAGAFQTASYYFTLSGVDSANGFLGTSTTSGGAIRLTWAGSTPNTVNAQITGKISIYRPTATNIPKNCIVDTMQLSAASTALRIYGGGFLNDLAAIDGLRFFFSSGNIAAGTFNLYGIKK